MSNRLADATIAVRDHAWEWVIVRSGRKILMPPVKDKRFMWTAMWDKDGLPHYLPKYSEGETE